MSVYLQRARTLVAAMLLAFAVSFGLAFATQAYAEPAGGGDAQQLVAGQGMPVQATDLSGDEALVTIGEGTISSKKTAPFYCYNNNGATETIYASDEIGMAGTIKSIAWQATNANTLTVNSLKIYFGHTSESAFSGSAITPDDLTLVYQSSEDFAGAAGYRPIVLDTPFEYNGVDNLLVVVVWAGKWNNAPEFYVESKAGMVWAKTSDSDADNFTDWVTIRDAAEPSSEAYPSQRPNVQFAIEEDVAEGAPTITTTALPSVNLGEAYSAAVKVKANPAATVTVTGLPSGLSFDATTMMISGTPTQAGTFPITITAANGIEPDANVTLNLVVNTEAPAITTESLPNGKVGKAYNATIEATGVPAPAISVAGLPAGLVFDDATNTISGTPTEAGDASVTATAHNGYGDDAVKTFSFTIKSAAASEEIEVVIGTGTESPSSGNGVPFHNYYRNAVSQSVYLGSEIVNEGEAVEEGTINAISYYVATPTVGGISNTLLDIYLGYTSATEAGATGLEVADRTLVYSNHSGVSTGSAEGWESFELDEPFEYDSSKGNLIVTIVRTASSYDSKLAYQASVGKTGLFRNDSTAYTDVDEGIAHIHMAMDYRANIKLSMEVGGSAPKFSAQPEGFIYKAGEPQDTALSAAAASKVGVPSFVWYKSDDGNLADAAAVAANATPVTEPAEGAAADGAYVSTYTPAATDLTAAGTVYYYCVATDTVGSTTSKPAAVQVYTEDAQVPVGTFTITSDPAAEDGVVTAGETTTVTFTASGIEPAVTGDVIYYQWYKKGADDADFVAIDGATEDTYAAKVVVGETAYQCRAHASHQIESNISEDVESDTITVNGTALTITTAEELADFRDAVNGTGSYTSSDIFNGRTVLLGADIDISDIEGGWVPIGASANAKRFAGTFDGQGHTIKIGAFAEGVTNPALFGNVRGEATIKNLTVTGTIESDQYNVSAVANTSYGATFENVRNLADVSATYASGRAAGIVAAVGGGGSDDPTVFKNCANKGNISTGGRDGYASGIANLGSTSAGCIATFENCYNTGTISGVATMYGDCYISGIVTINKNNNNANTLTNCYNAGTLSGGEYERGYGLASKAALVGDNYFLEGAPDGGVGTNSGTGAAVSKTADEMAAEGFVGLLGESYIAGSALDPAQATPALAWESTPVEPTSVKINLLGQIDKNTLSKVLFDFEVGSDEAAKYGYTKPSGFEDVVTMADAAAALHYELYGEDFAANPNNYLKISSAGTCTMIFGEPTYMNGFRVNDVTPEYPDQPGTGSLWNDTPLADGDNVRIFKVNGETYGMFESYLMFDKGSYAAHEDGSVDVVVTGDLTFGTMMGMPANVAEVEGATVYAVTDFTDPAGTKVAEAVTGEDGVATLEGLPAGDYHLVVVEYENDYEEDCFSTPYAELTVAAHEWDAGSITAFPTFESVGTMTYRCTVEGCEATMSEDIPAYGFSVTVNGEAIPAEDIVITPDGYDASYTDYMSGARVESIVPLATVIVPIGTETVSITLNNSFAEYQNYYYTAEPDESGESQYVGLGFGDQVDTYNKVAYADTTYDDVALPAEGNVIRMQTAFDSNYISHNLYAIAFGTLASDSVKAELAQAIADAKAVDVSGASDEAKSALTSAISEAEAVAENPKATEKQVADAKSALEAALKTATDEQAAADKQKAADELAQAIANAKAANVSDASAAAKQALAEAILAAESAVANPVATAADLADAKSALEAALKKATDEQAAADKQKAANGLPVGSTFTVKDANGTWTYKVTAAKQVTLTKAAKTKKKGKATINTASHQGVTYSVTAIGPKALKGSKLAKVTIGNNVASIGKLAFQKSKNLKALTVGKNVASIGAKAFSGDKKLKKITVKSPKLTAAKAVKGALKGSKVKTVKLSGVKGAAKKKAKKAFAKAGKKGVKVK